MEEKDLYLPIKTLLIEQGFSVKGEVKGVDIFGMRKDFSIAVELKTGIQLKLIYQAIERQKIADSVYIAIPKEAIKAHQGSYKHFVTLLKRLEIGLIAVEQSVAKVIFESGFYDLSKSRLKSKKKKESLIKEFTARKSNDNIGGTKGKVMTHYKENVISIALELSKFKIASIKELKEITQIDQISSILQKNYDGWFSRVERGRYELTKLGKNQIKRYQEPVIKDEDLENNLF